MMFWGSDVLLDWSSDDLLDGDSWLNVFSDDWLDDFSDDWLNCLDDLVSFNWFTTDFGVESMFVVSGVVNNSAVTVSIDQSVES